MGAPSAMLKASLILAAVVAAYAGRGGYVNDGRWYCSGTFTLGKGCNDGKFYCTCPGDRATAWYKIGCCAKGLSCGDICFPKSSTCSRYKNCAKCRSGISGSSKYACHTCKKGLEIGDGTCNKDINECATKNGGCDQTCNNRWASYSCSCRNGFKLLSDGKTCEKLSCGNPGKITGGTVTATDNWEAFSWAKYTCNKPGNVVVGPYMRKCSPNTQGKVYWNDKAPVCTDTCAVIKDTDKIQCGNPYTRENKCVELGCCYKESTDSYAPSCFFNPVMASIPFPEQLPKTTPITRVYIASLGACAFNCIHFVPGCKSFGIEQILISGQDAKTVTLKGCYFYGETYNELVDQKKLTTKEGFTLFQVQSISMLLQTHSASIQKREVSTVLAAGTVGCGNHRAASCAECPLQNGKFVSSAWCNGQCSWDSKTRECKATSMIAVSATNKFHVGCFKDRRENPDFPFYQYSSTGDMTVQKCIDVCREQMFQFAGLQNGKSCYCSNSMARVHGESNECTSPCTGDRGTACGGYHKNSVYRVPYDKRYIGCYKTESSRYSEVSSQLTGFDSASQCVEYCSNKGYKFAGVQNGGVCSCKNDYEADKQHPDDEEMCNAPCNGWGHQNCGGAYQTAVYAAQPLMDISTGSVMSGATKTFDSTGKVTGISTRMFTMAPKLRSIVLNKLVIYAENEVQTPSDDRPCATTNCYSACGEFPSVAAEEKEGDVLVLRAFHMNLKDIKKYDNDKSIKKVLVYAETVVIDSSINVNFALMVRARQLIVDRSMAHSIFVNSRAVDLGIDIDDTKINGPEPDLLHRKMMYMCSRILMETYEQKDVLLAGRITHSISNNMGKNTENQALSATVRTIGSQTYSMVRQNCHQVPIYTKTHISKMLANYYERVSIYKTNMERLETSMGNKEAFLNIAEDMRKIYGDTNIAEARAEYDATLYAIKTANATYHRYSLHYSESRDKLEESKNLFQRGLKEKMAYDIIKGVFALVGCVAKLCVGIVDLKDAEVLKDAISTVVEDGKAVVDSVQVLSKCIQNIESLDRMTEQIFNDLDNVHDVTESLKFADDLEILVNMKSNLIHWANFRTYSELLLDDDIVAEVNGAKEYKTNMLDTANWGEAMTNAMIEKSKLIQYSMENKFRLNAKIKQEERLGELFAKSHQGISSQQEVMRSMEEQMLDVRIDLNDGLIMFCQAFFYENLYECKESYKPSFGDSLTDLLLKINAARADSLLIEGPVASTASRTIVIEDSDTDPECNDAKECPVNYFRNHGTLLYDISLDERELIDLDKYMVSEISFQIEGAKPSGRNQYLKLRIESSGNFDIKFRGSEFHFLNKPLAVAYEYNINTGRVTLHADVYKPYRNIVNHITPYTTWMIRVAKERSEDIDLSGVSAIKMRLDGSAIDAFSMHRNSMNTTEPVV